MKRLIAVWENPREIILYERPKDPYGSILDDRWSVKSHLKEESLKELLDNNKIVKLSKDDDRGIYGINCVSCYMFIDETISTKKEKIKEPVTVAIFGYGKPRVTLQELKKLLDSIDNCECKEDN